MSTQSDPQPMPTLFGHPAGLYTLFFAEMWERFSYYGMRALLVFYTSKGFLGYNDSDAYAVYGAYTSLVYMTPFFGGMLADRLLGARRAVVMGGLLMAAGQLLLTVPNSFAYFTALALLICGNGFFKPNISTIVGSLYPPASSKRDGGFTIFYMGINLGAAMSPLLCGYIGETYGWHYGFGLATIGMLVGLAVFVAPTWLTQSLVLAGALSAAAGLCLFHPNDTITITVNILVAVALIAAAGVAIAALGRGGLPKDAGVSPDPKRLHQRPMAVLRTDWLIYLGTLAAIVLFVLLVSGFAPLTDDNRPITIIPESVIETIRDNPNPVVAGLAEFVKEVSRPAGVVLVVAGLAAFLFIVGQTFALKRIPRQRMYVVLILTFFSMLFWAFFEQAGISINNFTDRNIDRVRENRGVTQAEIGSTIEFRIPVKTDDPELAKFPFLSQEQLGYTNSNPAMASAIADAIRHVEKEKKKLTAEKIEKRVQQVVSSGVFTISGLTYLRASADAEDASRQQKTVRWIVAPEHVGMGIAESEIPASAFQAINPVCILLFGLAFSALWTVLGSRGLEPSTTVKFALGLLQLGLGFGFFWYGTRHADPRGMVASYWLVFGYMIHTTGELCLSPVGLSMITKLSPARLVSTVMGIWFLATAFSQFLAAIIAQFTSMGDAVPAPIKTVHVYGNVFGIIACISIALAILCFALSPILTRWTHPHGAEDNETN